MSNRWFRFVIALLAIGAAAGAGYRVFQHEQQLAGIAAATRAGEYAAESAITTISEIKAAMHAYVAPGQGRDFWTKRAGLLMDKLRGSLADLARAASRTDVALTEEAGQFDRLVAADKRARTHLSAGQLLLTGEVVFTEARDALDAIQLGVAGIRDAIRQAGDRQDAEIRREQTILGLGAAAVMVMAILVLVPPGRPAPVLPVAPVQRTPAVPVPARELSSASYGERAERRPKVHVGSTAPAAPVMFLPDAAAVCTDLGRVSQSNEISSLLGRAAAVLSASGVIVWIASENRDELFPAAASGYDERLFERIGSIPRDASNLTASSFRSGVSKTSASREGSSAALAVPLLTPHGPVGVFSAELREIPEVDTDRLAVAAIFAAQLASLLGSMSANTEAVSEVQVQSG